MNKDSSIHQLNLFIPDQLFPSDNQMEVPTLTPDLQPHALLIDSEQLSAVCSEDNRAS